MASQGLSVPPLEIRRGRLSRLDPIFVLSGAVCALLVLVAVFGPMLAPYAPNQTDVLFGGQGPSATHWLGTDSLGRDIFSRLLAGARVSFSAAGLIAFISVTLGTAVAILAAWKGGWVDRSLTRLTTLMFAIPGVLVAILAVAVFGVGFWAPAIALSLVYIPYIARVVRSSAIVQRNLAYVEACQLAGMSSLRINVRHILRNVLPVVLATATIGFASALLDFGAISFLGLGVQPPQAEWGQMVEAGRAEALNGAVQQSLSAGLMIVITVVAFNLLGERLTAASQGER